MDDCIKDVLRKDMRLFRKYDKAQARYILSLSDDYEIIDVDLDLNDNELISFAVGLAENDMCFDEWAVNVIKEMIKQSKEE